MWHLLEELPVQARLHCGGRRGVVQLQQQPHLAPEVPGLRLSIHPSIYPSIQVSIYPSIHLGIYLSKHIYIYIYIISSAPPAQPSKSRLTIVLSSTCCDMPWA